MKETISYYYNIYPDKLYEIDNGVYFFFNDIKYYFVKFNRAPSEIDFLVNISNQLYNNNILVDTFIINKDNMFYVTLLNDIYVLIRVNMDEDDILSLDDVIKFNNLLILSEDRRINNDWATLWMKKIDDFELEVSEFNTDYPIIQNSIDYFVGLAENAVSYFKDTISEEDLRDTRIVISHNRIHSEVYTGYINNPLTFTFDYEVRDIAEYIKSKFFEDKLNMEEVERIIYSNNYSKSSLRMLFARILYPSYYFDALEKVLIGEIEEEKLLKYIDKVSLYEDLLVNIFELINSKVNIPRIEWLFDKSS